MQHLGRKIIYTYVPQITRENVIDVLNSALTTHQENAERIKFLFDYEAGDQPLCRNKTYRSDVDVHCVDNVAHEITKFHVGYEWGNPITLIQRGEKDSGENPEESLAISMLNEQYEAEGIKTKTQKLGKDVTICNLGYTYVDVKTDWEEGDSYFELDTLSPYTTFLIRSGYYLDRRPMMGVTYNVDDMQVKHFSCFTPDTRYDIVENKIVLEQMNPLGKIPIIEWIGNYDGMGIWEHEISEMDNLNLMISDFSNDVEQNMQAIWHTNDVDFPTQVETDEEGNVVLDENGEPVEETITPKSGEWMQTYTPQNGKTPIVEPLVMNYDYANMLNNITTRRNTILEKCYMPSRGEAIDTTGVASSNMSGWTALDTIAESIQACQESAKMEEIKVVLAAINNSPYVPADSPLLTIKAMDIQPNVKRMRLSEMSTKVNSMATMLSHGIYGLHAIQTSNLFPDANQVWADSKDLIEQYQASIFNTDNEAVGGENEEAPNADRLMQDLSDQAENSPSIDS